MRYFKYWWPTLCWMALIFYFSSQHRVQVSDDVTVQFLVFKSLHVIEYALLYMMLYRSFRNTRNDPSWKHRFHAFLIAFTFAITDEIHQVFIPTREGRMRDVGIDTIGITLAFVYIWKLLPRAPPKLKFWAKKLRLN